MRGAEPSAHSVPAVVVTLRVMQAAAQVLAPAPTIANRSQVARPHPLSLSFLPPPILPLTYLSSLQLSFVRFTSLSFPPYCSFEIRVVVLVAGRQGNGRH